MVGCAALTPPYDLRLLLLQRMTFATTTTGPSPAARDDSGEGIVDPEGGAIAAIDSQTSQQIAVRRFAYGGLEPALQEL